jgi:hypothetical protein
MAQVVPPAWVNPGFEVDSYTQPDSLLCLREFYISISAWAFDQPVVSANGGETWGRITDNPRLDTVALGKALAEFFYSIETAEQVGSPTPSERY